MSVVTDCHVPCERTTRTIQVSITAASDSQVSEIGASQWIRIELRLNPKLLVLAGSTAGKRRECHPLAESYVGCSESLSTLLKTETDRRKRSRDWMTYKNGSNHADIVILDLEDSVPPGEKEAAREIIADNASALADEGQYLHGRGPRRDDRLWRREGNRYNRALGFEWTGREGLETVHLRQQALMDARAAGIEHPLAGPYVDVGDIVINPSHVEHANELFLPDPKTVEYATAFEDSLGYAEERVQFDEPISEFQAIRFKLANMATEVEAARALTLLVAVAVDQDERADAEAAMAKLFASEVAERVTSEGIQIHGYTTDFDGHCPTDQA